MASVAGCQVALMDVAFDPNLGSTAYTYAVTAGPNYAYPPNMLIGGFGVQVIGCAVVGAEPIPFVPMGDPSIPGAGGIRWDQTLAPGESRAYKIVTVGPPSVGTVRFGISLGGMVQSGLIAGPNCECSGMPTPMPSPTGATPTPGPTMTPPPTLTQTPTPTATPTPLETCEPGPDSAAFGAFTLALQSNAYDPDSDSTKFTYGVTGDPGSTLARLALFTNGCVVIATDPPSLATPAANTPGAVGLVIWETAVGAAPSATYAITVAGRAGVGTVVAAIEGGDGVSATGSIAGPDCQCAQPPTTCSPGMASAVLNGFFVEFLGSSYDPASDSATFTYRVSGLGILPALSHFDIALNGCTVVSASPPPIEIGTDPTTGLTGVKWDSGLEIDASQVYTLVVAGNAGVGTVQAAVKGGNMFEIGAISGPDCACTGAGPTAATGVIAGSVVRAGAPVAGARVSYRQMDGGAMGSAVTDAEGRYHMEGLPSGTYRVALRARRCPMMVRCVTVEAGEACPANFAIRTRTRR